MPARCAPCTCVAGPKRLERRVGARLQGVQPRSPVSAARISAALGSSAATCSGVTRLPTQAESTSQQQPAWAAQAASSCTTATLPVPTATCSRVVPAGQQALSAASASAAVAPSAVTAGSSSCGARGETGRGATSWGPQAKLYCCCRDRGHATRGAAAPAARPPCSRQQRRSTHLCCCRPAARHRGCHQGACLAGNVGQQGGGVGGAGVLLCGHLVALQELQGSGRTRGAKGQRG